MTDILNFYGFKISVFVYLFSEGENNASSSLKTEYHTFKLHDL